MSKSGKKQQRIMTTAEIALVINSAGFFLRKNTVSGEIEFHDMKTNIYRKLEILDKINIEDALTIIRNRDQHNLYTNQLHNEKEVKTAIIHYADMNPYNPIKDYLLGCKDLYSGIQHSYFEDIVNCLECDEESEPFKRQILEAWFNNLVHIVFQKNPEDDNFIIVFAGPQGIGKTTFFRKLCRDIPKYFYEGPPIPGDRDCERRLGYKLVWCWDELQTAMKGKIIEQASMKAFLTKMEVTTRRMYAEDDSHIKRITSFCGTTNEDRFLNDPTGDRRYAVLKVIKINQELLNSIDMSLFWGEVMTNYWLDGEKKKIISSIQNKANIRFVQGGQLTEFIQDHFEVKPGWALISSEVTKFIQQGINNSFLTNHINISKALNNLGAQKSENKGRHPALWINLRWREELLYKPWASQSLYKCPKDEGQDLPN